MTWAELTASPPGDPPLGTVALRGRVWVSRPWGWLRSSYLGENSVVLLVPSWVLEVHPNRCPAFLVVRLSWIQGTHLYPSQGPCPPTQDGSG